ncbi:MAG: septal ring lytic transglycosylase RlpA family protein [Alphaproteobacteria bacterium]|nr:septal ring lytic transglycosylase RlpA family protein [Alphaproteobacteria bacterium]
MARVRGSGIEHRIRPALAAAAGLGFAACSTSGVQNSGGGSPHFKVGAPYEIAGKTYRPAVDRGYDAVGVASWYGDPFHGRQTANGERFDKRQMTAAHKTLPLPTMVEVTNLENGRSTVVRVNDRGPFVEDRLIDLSEAAAEKLGFHGKGLARVRVRYLADAQLPGALRVANRDAGKETRRKTRQGRRLGSMPSRAKETQAKTAATMTKATVAGSAAKISSPQPAAEISSILAAAADGSAETLAVVGSDNRLWLSLGAYNVFEDADAAFARAEAAFAPLGTEVAIHSEDIDLYRLTAGPFARPEDVQAALIKAQSEGFLAARIASSALEGVSALPAASSQ